MKSQIDVLSVGVIALNEERYLPALLAAILAQDFPKEKTEIVLIDSGSADSTKQIMRNFIDIHRDEYANIQILDNPKKILPAGWNVLLANFSGDAIVRIDAHARIPNDFLSRITKVLESGEMVCGGERPCVVGDDATDWDQVLLAAEESSFGSSAAVYRGAQKEKKYVTSIFHGAYRREVFAEVGNFDERLVRTEDNDIHYRIRQAGFNICLDPKIKSWQVIRPNLKAMTKQKYSNGYWAGRTLFIQPKCLSIHHLIPGIFVSAIGVFGVLAVFKKSSLFKLLLGVYAFADVIMSIMAVKGKAKNLKAVALPVIFPILHVSYGLGTIKGIVQQLFKRQ